MVLLFALEFVESNTITRLYFMRLRHLARVAVTEGRVTPQLARARAEQLASFTHGHERADFAAVRNAASLQRCGKVVVSAEGGAW